MFNERMQAFLVLKYYEYLKEKFDDRGVQAFIHATRYYAGQRGRRMARRAIHDGKTLDYDTYSEYGEWKNTEESVKCGIANKFEFIKNSPDTEMKVRDCPWRYEFKEKNSEEAGMVYCTYLDRAIVHGFNPEIDYRVDLKNLDGAKDEYCIHCIKNHEIKNKKIEKYEPGLRSFEYHSAHLYWSFREVAIDIFSYDGFLVANKVLEDFSKEFGKDCADSILKYRNTNFNSIVD